MSPHVLRSCVSLGVLGRGLLCAWVGVFGRGCLVAHGRHHFVLGFLRYCCCSSSTFLLNATPLPNPNPNLSKCFRTHEPIIK